MGIREGKEEIERSRKLRPSGVVNVWEETRSGGTDAERFGVYTLQDQISEPCRC